MGVVKDNTNSEQERSMDDRYTVQQRQPDGSWSDWFGSAADGGICDIFRARTFARVARNQGRTVRIVDAFGQEVR